MKNRKSSYSLKYLGLTGSMILFISINSFAQNNGISLGLWNISNLSGELKAGGLYGLVTTKDYGYVNRTVTQNFYGGLMLKTQTYFWTPTFLTFDIEGGYTPETFQNQNLIFPSRFDVINSKRLLLNSVLFSGKPISFSGNFNISSSYDTREGLTDVQSDSKSYGGGMVWRNKKLPISISMNQNDWNSKEIGNGHSYNYKQNNLIARTFRNFGKRDRNELVYTRHNYWREDYNLASIRNISDNLELNNSYMLDDLGNSRFGSRILGISQVGQDTFKQVSVNENLFYKLPHNFNSNLNYSLYDNIRTLQTVTQNVGSASINHQLFESLHSNIMGEYSTTNATDYTENFTKAGIDFNYMKRIPFDGMISLSYGYDILMQRHNSADAYINILQEEYVLDDSKVVKLKRPYVVKSSIVVKDVTGTIIYHENLDYILVEYNSYIEIRRIPGGQIANNSSVYLFYTVMQQGNYAYNVNVNSYSASLSLFGRLLSLYATRYTQTYTDVTYSANLSLDQLNHNLYGTRVEYKVITVGTEFDDYQSSIYPYKMIRIFANTHGNLGSRCIYTLSANAREMVDLPLAEPDRKYIDANGMLSYGISSRTKLDLNVGYQKQIGKDLDLDLFTSRLKIATYWHGLNVIFGFDAYERQYLTTQVTDYVGAYIQVIKRF